MNDIGVRLRSERTRLGFNQSDFGALGGVQKLAQIKYEKGDRFPNADYLQAVANAGADIQYIVTGKKSVAEPKRVGWRVEFENGAVGWTLGDPAGRRRRNYRPRPGNIFLIILGNGHSRPRN
ncbi:MAG: helix-turn-helix domain-containing protein (plasmid) [Pseudomonas rhizophila]|uniref:helix-turn-helix domain-containing protein n=1 Tax=Pseudomonas rhizophila TaxID=2045200 RepID=UPI003F6AB7AC